MPKTQREEFRTAHFKLAKECYEHCERVRAKISAGEIHFVAPTKAEKSLTDRVEGLLPTFTKTLLAEMYRQFPDRKKWLELGTTEIHDNTIRQLTAKKPKPSKDAKP